MIGMFAVARRGLLPTIATAVSCALMVVFIAVLPNLKNLLASEWSSYSADYGPTFPYMLLLVAYALALLVRQTFRHCDASAQELRHVLDIAAIIFVLGLLGTYIPFELVLRSGSTDLRHLGQAVASTKLGLTLLVCLRIAVMGVERFRGLDLKAGG